LSKKEDGVVTVTIDCYFSLEPENIQKKKLPLIKENGNWVLDILLQEYVEGE
jgi:hypothetical protein